MTSSLPIMVDTSPPQPGSVSVYTMHEQQKSTREEDLIVQWTAFQDRESGIRSYDLAIGSHEQSQDILPFTPVTGFITFVNGQGMLASGNKYYFHIKVSALLIV